MDDLTSIGTEDLIDLKQLYEVKKPLNVVTTVAIGHFIKRFTNKPEWTNTVKFWSIENNWKETGTFVMINSNFGHIYFDTLEPYPNESLHKTLQLINYDKAQIFVCFRDIFRPIVLDVVRVQNLNIVFDTGARAIYDSLHDVDINTEIVPPDGFYLDDLRQCHVEKLNSSWPQRYPGSYEFLSNSVAQNPSTGLFNKESGELVAWNVMHDTGVTGHLFVDDRYRRKRFAEIVALEQRMKIKKQRCDAIGFIVHENKAALTFSNHMENKWIGNVSWIGIRPKQPRKTGAMWGHL